MTAAGETHMARETAQAPDAVAALLEANRAGLAEFGHLVRARDPSHFVTCARGSSDNAASYFKYLAEILLGIPCCSIGASVVSIYEARLRLRGTVLVTTSQSGQSPDILAFQAEAKRVGVPTVAVTNDEASPLARDADLCLPLMAGPELSVAATKTFVTSCAMSAAMVAAGGAEASFAEAIAALPADLAAAQALRWTKLEESAVEASSLYVLGRGPSLPIAQEAALKLKETSGLHAEAYSAAEVMHGPMELVGPGFPVFVLVADDAARPTTAKSVERLAAAGADISWPEHHRTRHTALDPLSIVQTFYGSAERIARQRGRNPDRPRLLAKVTQTR